MLERVSDRASVLVPLRVCVCVRGEGGYKTGGGGGAWVFWGV